jgi:hypothetical protein
VASSAALCEGRGHVLVVVASVSELCLQDRIQSSALSVVTGATGTVQGSCVSETRHPSSLEPQTSEPLWTPTVPQHHTFISLKSSIMFSLYSTTMKVIGRWGLFSHFLRNPCCPDTRTLPLHSKVHECISAYQAHSFLDKSLHFPTRKLVPHRDQPSKSIEIAPENIQSTKPKHTPYSSVAARHLYRYMSGETKENTTH